MLSQDGGLRRPWGLRHRGLGDDCLLFQPSLFSKTCRFGWVSGGFLERIIPGKNGEGTIETPLAVRGRGSR